MNMYGVLDHNGNHIDVSKTLQGAKCCATRNAYHIVSIRYNCGYNCAVVSRKIDNKWVNEGSK